MAVFKSDPRAADTSGWDRFGNVMEGIDFGRPDSVETDDEALRERGPELADEKSGFTDRLKAYMADRPEKKGWYGEHRGIDFLQDDKGLFQEGSMTDKGKSVLGKVALGGLGVGASIAAPGLTAGAAGLGAAGYGLYKAGKSAVGFGKDMLQDDKGFFQEGRYAGPGLSDVSNFFKDAGGRMGAYFNKPKPTVEPPTEAPVIEGQPVINSDVVSGENVKDEPAINNVSTQVAEGNDATMQNTETGQTFDNLQPAVLLSKVQDPTNPGENPETLQMMLKKSGYDIAVDGKWGPQSIAAMEQWMASNQGNAQNAQTPPNLGENNPSSQNSPLQMLGIR